MILLPTPEWGVQKLHRFSEWFLSHFSVIYHTVILLLFSTQFSGVVVFSGGWVYTITRLDDCATRLTQWHVQAYLSVHWNTCVLTLFEPSADFNQEFIRLTNSSSWPVRYSGKKTHKGFKCLEQGQQLFTLSTKMYSWFYTLNHGCQTVAPTHLRS